MAIVKIRVSSDIFADMFIKDNELYKDYFIKIDDGLPPNCEFKTVQIVPPNFNEIIYYFEDGAPVDSKSAIVIQEITPIYSKNYYHEEL